MACAGVVGAFEALAKVEWSKLEMQLASWEKALKGHKAVQTVRRALGHSWLLSSQTLVLFSEPCMLACRGKNGPGVLLFWFLSVPNAFRLAPPLTCTADEMSQGLTLILQASIKRYEGPNAL